jgi:hypothetical protein
MTDEEKDVKLCKDCGEHKAVYLEPKDAGPVHGEVLEERDVDGNITGSRDYCSYLCWESDVKLKRKLAEEE